MYNTLGDKMAKQILQSTAKKTAVGPDTRQDATYATVSQDNRSGRAEDYASQSRYNLNYFTFPEDLGGKSYNDHYMVININVQENSKMNQVTGPGGALNIALTGLDSKTDQLRYTIDNQFTAGGAAGTTLGQNKFTSKPRFTKRIKESIALYMPNAELTFNDTHDFENISLTKFGATAASGALSIAAASIGAIVGGAAGAAGATARIGAITDSAAGLAQFAGQVGQVVFNRPINPKVEVLYANTMQREHRFDFIFAPSSEKESESLRSIIRTLRYHAAPELSQALGGAGSFFWIPPAEFDIAFYHRGEENTKIPRINTCALTQIDVSYSPNGAWTTFYDGFPTQIRMQLAFREVEVTHKLRVLQGF